MTALNFFYYPGQVFDLNQKTMNLMIEDVHTLKAQLTQLQEQVKELQAENEKLRDDLSTETNYSQRVLASVSRWQDDLTRERERVKELQEENAKTMECVENEERICMQVMEERDSHEECINDIANALGDESEWSSHNHRGERAMELIEAMLTDLTREREKSARLQWTLNEIDHVLNWDADHICKCFTKEYRQLSPKCQYHEASKLIRAALSCMPKQDDCIAKADDSTERKEFL